MKSHLLGVVCASFIISYSSFAPAASFTPLGFLNSGTSSFATGISADGTVVVGNANSSVSSIAIPFIWTAASGMRSLGSISGTEFLGSASAISANGSVVVGQSNGLAYRWTATTSITPLGGFPSGTTSTAKGVSDDGNVVVGNATAPGSQSEGFRWTPATNMLSLGALSSANGVSGDGSVVVGRQSECCASYWTEGGGWTDLENDFLFTGADVASADGSVILGSQDPPGLPDSDAFRWTMDAGVTFLVDDGTDGLLGSGVFDVSSNGGIAVGDLSTGIMQSSQLEAALWDEANTIHLIADMLTAEGIDLTGWELRTATGLSDDGLIIAGIGTNPDGHQEAWIANVVPIPTAFYLFASGLLGLVGIARRKKA